MTTLQGELVERDDQPGVYARRTRRVYEDLLGREWKTEAMNWDGATVYSTTVQSFNGRDQVLLSRQYAGPETSPTYQDTTATFDGHGRVWKTHDPEQIDPANAPSYTITTYNADDTISSVTDGRGAMASYVYNGLRLVTQINYSVPQGSDVTVTPTISFAYDNLGNRIQMLDGTGTTQYQYNELSQIVSETKQFEGIAGIFTLLYGYELNGAVRQISILPNDTIVTYNFDKIGRAGSVSGQGFIDDRFGATIGNLGSEIQYRAWNGLKSMSFGNPATVSIDYNNRLRVSSFRIPNLMEIDYQYYADGRVSFSDDILNSTFDRSYKFDHELRLISAKSGSEASGGTGTSVPYRQSNEYDAFGNMTYRETINWTTSAQFWASYANNRRNGWQHDADGNLINAGSGGTSFVIDANGENTVTEYPVEVPDPELCAQTHRRKLLYYDGDGQISVEHDETKNYCVFSGGQSTLTSTNDVRNYNLKSTVLGGSVVFQVRTNDTWSSGGTTSNKVTQDTRIFLHGKLLANMSYDPSQSASWQHQFYWRHVDPSATTIGESQLQSTSGFYQRITTNLDPSGADVGFGPPVEGEPPPPTSLPWEFGSPEDVDWITVDGVTAPANQFPPGLLASASQCPRSGCGPIRTENGWEWWTGFADGYEGYVPENARYEGNGRLSFQTAQQRKPKKKKPELKKRAKLSKAEAAQKRAIADTGIYDNEDDFSNVDPPSPLNFWESLGFALKMATLIDRRVKIIGFSESQTQKIVDSLAVLTISPDCVSAFRRANIPTPAEVIRDHGVIIANFDEFAPPLSQALRDAGITEQLRFQTREHGNEALRNYGTGFTVNARDTDAAGLPRITVLFNHSFKGKIFPFDEVSAHETIHRSGVGAFFSFSHFFGLGGHDLTGYDNYEDIVQNCGTSK